MSKKIDSIKHNKDTRVHIPSKEEAGYEDANEKVQAGKKILELPKNPVVHRGQDPELFWLNKYGNDDRDDLLRVDIRSLYRHEHIAPETLIKNLYKITETKSDQFDLFSINELFGNALEKDELEKIGEYYKHNDGWTNRLIQGDSHLVMASLLEREGMAGQVQTIYFDPPYGIKYGGNWQIKLNNRDVKDGNDEALTGEPEQIKAFRDTWELGIHSYLSYLRDRLLIAKELLTESGSCFVQIGDENVHLVRSVMDEVFGSENFFSFITFKKTLPLGSSGLAGISDYILWYAKDKEKIKYRQLYTNKQIGQGTGYTWVEFKDGTRRKMTVEERSNPLLLPKETRVFFTSALASSGYTSTCMFDFEFEGKIYSCGKKSWRTNQVGMKKLIEKKRIIAPGDLPCYILYHDDFPIQEMHNLWDDTHGATEIKYVVQTSNKVIQRCILMSTDPGDLVLDPTCGSGTTAYVAEQWGRRWITIDTSRIALTIAKQRLMTAVFPYYKLYDKDKQDIRQGFIYKEIHRVTLGSIANDEPSTSITIYDEPSEDNKKLRVSGPFTVETLQNFEPTAPEELETENLILQTDEAFEEVIKQHLVSAGVKNGRKDEHVVFTRIELLSHSYLHAEGFYSVDSGQGLVGSGQGLVDSKRGERKAYFHIGPKFGTVSKNSVNEAIKECRIRGDANWLVILGFSFESDIEGSNQTMNLGYFEVTKARIHDDLLQEGLKKKPAKSAASFVTIGEPDIDLVDSGLCLVDSNNKILCNYDIFKKLSGIDSLAKINGLGQTDLSKYIILSQRRDVWVNITDDKSSSEHTGEHSGGTGTQHNGGIPSIFGDSQRFFSGIADFDNFVSEHGFADKGKLRKTTDELLRDRKIIEWANQLSYQKEFSTKHYTLTTIKGLDIYDPIKDEVKPRNVHDIAYWMVDDDYDGSNFIVKQVFFCGGDKDEFNKWKKGLSDAAKQDTKKKAEKTLRIEIDEEAFDRLYGHISHPIEIKKPNQKIAVRIISQFGEECTKVLTV